MTSAAEGTLPPLVGHRRTMGGNSAFHNFYNDYSHIPDPNLRRRLALSEIDNVPFSFYHVRAVLVAGVGFLLDSYDIFAINVVTTLLGMVFYQDDNGALPSSINQALKASTSAGIVIGMVFFGWLADALGRRLMYGIDLVLIIFGTFCCTLVSSSPSIEAAGLMIFWRVVMGIGIGGDYPLSAVITSEFAPTRWRGAMIAAVFSMQGLGQLMSAIVALVTAVAFKDSYVNIANPANCDEACQVAADRSWRIIVGFGAIPACLALYYRITIPETPRYTFDVQHDVEKANADIRAYVHSKTTVDYGGVVSDTTQLDVPQASWQDATAYFRQWKNARALIGTTMSWFFLDLAFYGLGLNSVVVLDAIGYGGGGNVYEKLYNQAVGIIILTSAGSLPGYWTSIVSIDTVGRKPLQVFGFLLLTIIFCILGFRFSSLSEGAMLALYIIGQFLFNAGPNTTTFVVPGECFPTRYRATSHGLSAAMGKIGAIIAQVISIPILSQGAPHGCVGNDCSPNLDMLLKLFALFMLLGTLVSLLIPETRGVTLEELSGETRTSYNNVGYAGGTRADASGLQVLNPFQGGQPAGFMNARSRSWKFAGSRQSTRMGIMSSPELVEDGSAHRKWRFWARPPKDRNSSDESNEMTLNGRGGLGDGARGSMVGQPTEDQMDQQELPTWGAGWGRVDRGTPPTTENNMQLLDVGSLLRPI
ncbi:phosphate permease [Drechmeria coniospora]|uniref:Phosphate permease n=1 Tax=Drechmeria coniospora TaxID=98403 RepID=A0A151GWG4_DRECN|nr:phosphate permease [Drechmeria coniospora]KYK61383.1 phosphate permease [Drechmeria coniospora]ODA81144.1 hypothetical protein RJ55_04108 [Drechmeria coniospora]